MLYPQTFTTEEKILFSRTEELEHLAKTRYQPQFTHFLNPREQKIAFAATGQKGNLFGGYSDATRQIMGFPPPYDSVLTEDFPIQAVQLIHEKNTQLPHRWVLGSVLALGITRGSVGDILPQKGTCHVILQSSVVSLLLQELKQVGSLGVRVENSSLSEMKFNQEYHVMTGTISSSRLDTLVALLLRKSRGTAAVLIESGKVQLNYKEETKTSAFVQPSDVITIRGYGKYIFSTIGSPTKKNRHPVECRQLK